LGPDQVPRNNSSSDSGTTMIKMSLRVASLPVGIFFLE
jgi:hypothetical protein